LPGKFAERIRYIISIEIVELLNYNMFNNECQVIFAHRDIEFGLNFRRNRAAGDEIIILLG